MAFLELIKPMDNEVDASDNLAWVENIGLLEHQLDDNGQNLYYQLPVTYLFIW